jgi:hypothetical protein
MKNGFLLGLLAAGFAGASWGMVQAQTDRSGAECDRLINALRGKTPAEAHDALQRMDVYRQGGQYQACVDTGRTAQNRSSAEPKLQVGQAAGMDVFNEKGEQVGDIDRLARGSDQKVYVLMTYRGPRWPGNKQVASPIEDMSMDSGKLLLPGVGEKEILAMPAVPEDGGVYKALNDTETVSLPTAKASETGSIRTKP